MSDEKLTTPTATDNDFFLWINWYENSKLCLTFKRSCLNKKNATYTPRNRITFFIVYEWDEWSQDLNFDFTLKNSLFGGVKLAKNADRDKSLYICYGIGFDACSEFLFKDGSMGKNVITSGVDMTSSAHIVNKKKFILILGFGLTRGLDDTTLTAEAQYLINFSKSNKKMF